MKAKVQEVLCGNPACGIKFQVFVPEPQIISSPIMEQVVIMHPDPQQCPQCGAWYQMSLAKVGGIALAWKQVPPPPDERLIDLATAIPNVPPPGGD